MNMLLLLLAISSINSKRLLASSNDLISTSFEDSNISSFLARGGVTLTVKTDGGKTGNNYLLVSGRTSTWHGVQVALDNICTPKQQYSLSVQIKTPTAGQVSLSMQYTDSAGKEHYSNLRSVSCSGDWVAIEGFKFIMPSDVSKVYLYFESSTATLDIMLDDFVLAKVQHDDEDTLIETSFEDGDYSFFLPRGSVSLTVGTNGGSTGSKYLKVSGRTSSWNGVQISLSDLCEAGEQYLLSAKIKTPSSGQVSLSMQYTDSSGTDHYSNLKSVTSSGNWAAIEDYKFNMPSGVTGVYIYFECSTATLDIYLDDVVLRKAPSTDIETKIPSLKDVFAEKFRLGTAVTVAELSPKTTQKLILKHFNSITLGNELKPDALLDQQATLTLAQQTGDYTTPVINLGQAKTILDFCQLHDIPVRGHTLVWHSQTPTWFFKDNWDINGSWVDKSTMLKRMENYIKLVFETVSKAYPNIDFYAWDVVNEAWTDNGTPRTAGTLEENPNYSPWVKVFGDNSFIKYAFQYAKKYVMSGCKLFYNDFNEYVPAKTKAIVSMVTELNSSEKLIDGIGLQSHLDISYPSASVYETAVKAFVETGLDVQVTELDATVSGNSESLFKSQANYYKSIMSVLLKYSDKISAVVFWGTLDSTSWRASKYPLLFNGDYTSKEAFKAIVGLLDTGELINTSFEDNNLGNFSPRGSVTLTVETNGGKTGNNYLKVSGRTSSWNGVQLALDDYCEAGVQYSLSVQIKTPSSGQVTMSMQYTDSSGKDHYNNLRSVDTSSSSWVGIEEFKFIMPKDVSNVLLYFESSTATLDIYLDDFVLKKVQNENKNSLIDTSFEDGDYSFFLPRGSVTLTVKTDGGKTGNNYLLVSGRTNNWNGVQVSLDDLCEVGEQYTLSAQIKTPTSGQVTLSMQYTDSSGKEHYSNLRSVTSSGDWVGIEGFKFIMPKDVTGVYLYFECSSSTLDIMVDDFSLKKVQNENENSLIETSFEDGDYSFFQPRGSVSLTVPTDGGHTGSRYLKVSGRTSTWNGVQIPLSDLCEVGEQYVISTQIKTPYYGQVTLSMQYTDSSGTDHYNNLKTVISQGSWVAIEDYKFTMPKDVTGVLLYFESSTATLDICLDDFTLKKAASSGIETDIPSLKDVFANKFKLGTAVGVFDLSSKNTEQLILKHFNSITLGNELKPDALLDQQATLTLAQQTGDYTTPVINLGQAKTILDFCQLHDIPVRGHTLVWHSQTPTWFFKEKWDANGNWVDSDTMLKRMENYIKTVFETVENAYPKVNFYAWDVVNEAWLDNGQPRNAGSQEENSNNSPWVKIFGDNSFIKYAFQYAKKYAMSGCKLYYNDFNEYMPDKTKAIVAMVEELNSSEQLIDGIGLQSHLDVSFPSASAYETAVKAFVATGLDLQVTELDATVSGNTEALFKTQAEYYKSIFSVLLKYSDNISAVVIWGTLDSTSWRASKYPLLFNEDYTSKEAFKAIVELV